MIDAATGRRWPGVATCALLVAGGVVVAACANSPAGGPTAPTPTDGALSGRWTGTLSEPVDRTAQLVLVIDERPVLGGAGTALSGTWTLHFADDGRSEAGTLTGSTSGEQAAIGLDPASRPTCPSGPAPGPPPAPGTRSLLVSVSPGRLSGSSLFVDCTRSWTGTVDLTR